MIEDVMKIKQNKVKVFILLQCSSQRINLLIAKQAAVLMHESRTCQLDNKDKLGLSDWYTLIYDSLGSAIMNGGGDTYSSWQR